MRITKPIERWFPALKDPDKSETLIRHLTPGEIQDVINETSTQETRYQIRPDDNLMDIMPEMVSQQKPGESRRRLYLLAVKDWKNMFDENGNPMECNEENKLRAYRGIDGYAEFVEDCRAKLMNDVKKEMEGREKN